MAQPPTSTPSSAGIVLAGTIVLGAIIGIWQHQPSAGMLGGLVVGLAVILVQALLERRR